MKAKIEKMSDEEFIAAFPSAKGAGDLEIYTYELNMEEDLSNIAVMKLPMFVKFYSGDITKQVIENLVTRGFSSFYRAEGRAVEGIPVSPEIVNKVYSIVNESRGYTPVFTCGVDVGCSLVH